MDNSLQLEKEQKEVFQKEVQPIVNYANVLVIKSSEDSIGAQSTLKELKRRRAAIHEKFDPPVRAAHTAWKAAKDLYNFFVNPFDQAEVIIKRKVVTFEEQERRKREEEARLAEAKRQEAERKEREKLEAQAKAAEEKGKTEKAEALREKAETVTVAPSFTPPPPPQVKGTAFKKTWRATVTDKMALIREVAAGNLPHTVLDVNPSVLNGLAKTWKDTRKFGGVDFREETDMSVRGAA